MSNLSKTQLSFEFLNYSQKQFSELFNGLSSRDKNSFRNSQSGTGLNEMFDFLCSVLGKKVVDEKKTRKVRPKSSENRDEQTLTNQQNEQQAGNTQQPQVEPQQSKVEVVSKKVVKNKKPELSTEKVEPTQDKVELSNVSNTNVSQSNVSQSTPSNTKVAQSNDKKHVVKKSREHTNVAPNNE